MKDPLEDSDTIEIPIDDGIACDVCGDMRRHIIFDHYHGIDIDLCINCYVNRYGIPELIKNYGKQIAL